MLDMILINSPDVTYAPQYEADPKVPLGLLYIASYAKQFGYSSRILDCHAHAYTISSILEEIKVSSPRVVGVNITTPNRRVVYDIANAIKDYFPSLPLFIGGSYATSMPEDLFNHVPQLDAVILGEGEIVVTNILKSLPIIDAQDGIYRKEDYYTKSVPNLAPRITDLDALPMPDYDLIDLEKYLSVSRELYLSSSRGCIYDCSFCSIRSLLGKGVVSRTSTSVVAEIQHLKSKYGVERFYFYDDDFMLWENWSDFCDLVAPLGIKWTAQGTLNDVKGPEAVKKFARAGCYRLSFGIESGSNRLQRYVTKVIKDRSLELIPVFAEEGIQTRGYFVFGLPKEERDDVIETLLYLVMLRKIGLSDISVFAARPYPGTRLFLDCIERFGSDAEQDLLDFYYLDDWHLRDDDIIRERLRRYNTIPMFQINPTFTPMQIREIVALANEVFFHADKYAGYTSIEMNQLLDERLSCLSAKVQ